MGGVGRAWRGKPKQWMFALQGSLVGHTYSHISVECGDPPWAEHVGTLHGLNTWGRMYMGRLCRDLHGLRMWGPPGGVTHGDLTGGAPHSQPVEVPSQSAHVHRSPRVQPMEGPHMISPWRVPTLNTNV